MEILKNCQEIDEKTARECRAKIADQGYNLDLLHSLLVYRIEPNTVAEQLYETYTSITEMITDDTLISEGDVMPGAWGRPLYLIRQLMEVFEYMTRFPKS